MEFLKGYEGGFVRSTSGLMTEETIRLILHDIDESRIN